jgi:hypothetical protein
MEACTLPSASILNDIPFRITEITSGDVRLALYTEVPAKKAVKWGESAGERLLPILLALIPLYEMCVGVVDA